MSPKQLSFKGKDHISLESCIKSTDYIPILVNQKVGVVFRNVQFERGMKEFKL